MASLLPLPSLMAPCRFSLGDERTFARLANYPACISSDWPSNAMMSLRQVVASCIYTLCFCMEQHSAAQSFGFPAGHDAIYSLPYYEVECCSWRAN
eukprot:scaffold654348_cov76-Prasinocladus_malaysianus.AAC.1